MYSLRETLDSIQLLCQTGALSNEESFRLTLSGENLSLEQVTCLETIISLLDTLLPECVPSLLANNSHIDIDDLSGLTDCAWRLVIPKSAFVARCKKHGDKQTIFFFSEKGLSEWLESLSPFKRSSPFDPDFNKSLVIYVNGLTESFGGPSLSILSLNDRLTEKSSPCVIPNSESIHAVVHTDSNLKLSPQHWALTWGRIDSPSAQAILRLSCLTLGACLTSSLKYSDETIVCTIRGTKQHTLPLWHSNNSLNWICLQRRLIKAVSWVYSERPETRLKLLMDRLTLDLHSGDCLLACLYRHLDLALTQAEDSYQFVILDRKDEYYKEMREIMKDMRSQADHYANKTREIITFLTRDFLGVFLLLTILLVRQLNLSELATSPLPSTSLLILRSLAAYLVTSFALQLSYQLRDSNLLYKESKSWLNILSNYTNQQEKERYFLQPIKERKNTLSIALFISGALYTLLALAIWFFPKVLELGLSQL